MIFHGNFAIFKIKFNLFRMAVVKASLKKLVHNHENFEEASMKRR